MDSTLVATHNLGACPTQQLKHQAMMKVFVKDRSDLSDRMMSFVSNTGEAMRKEAGG